MIPLLDLLLAAAVADGGAHRCIFDEHSRTLQAHATANFTRRALVAVGHAQAYEDAAEGRRLDDTADSTFTWLPLRIVAQYIGSAGDEGSFETDLAATMGSADGKVLSGWLKGTAMPAVITRLGELYSTSRVTGNLFAFRACAGVYTSGALKGKCATLQAASIGCNNIGDEVSIAWPASQLGEQITYNSDGTVAATTTPGNGLPIADFSIFVTGKAASNCAGGTLAYASTCQRDQYDRPTYGRANMCANPFTSFTGSALVQALASRTGASFIGEIMHSDGSPKNGDLRLIILIHTHSNGGHENGN